MSQDKPIVYFERLARFEHHSNNVTTAVLREIHAHPRLGDLPLVYTSAVIDVQGDKANPTRIETRNTIYLRREEM